MEVDDDDDDAHHFHKFQNLLPNKNQILKYQVLFLKMQNRMSFTFSKGFCNKNASEV